VIGAAMALRARRELSTAPAPAAKVSAADVAATWNGWRAELVDGRTEFQKLLADLRAQNEAGGDGLKRLQRIADARPALAIELALALGTNDDERAEWVTELTRTWAGRDAQAAWDWLGQELARMEQLTGNALIGVVLNEMAARAPQRVIDNVDALLRRGDVEGGIPALVACQLGLDALLAHGDLGVARAAVEEWIQNPRTQAIDASAFNVVAEVIARDSWDDAAAWLDSLPPSPERASAFAVLASKWADEDPVAALNWAETVGPEHGQFGAIRTVFADWVERDASRAADWLLGYIDRAKADSDIDQLIGSFVTNSIGLRKDPALAMGWVGLMRDGSQREASAERLIVRWGHRDLAAANRYVDTAPEFSTLQRQNLKANLSALANDPEPMDD
jgi:hypothetical protein